MRQVNSALALGSEVYVVADLVSRFSQECPFANVPGRVRLMLRRPISFETPSLIAAGQGGTEKAYETNDWRFVTTLRDMAGRGPSPCASRMIVRLQEHDNQDQAGLPICDWVKREIVTNEEVIEVRSAEGRPVQQVAQTGEVAQIAEKAERRVGYRSTPPPFASPSLLVFLKVIPKYQRVPLRIGPRMNALSMASFGTVNLL